MATATIPCKRPKVSVVRRADVDSWVVACQVPGCDYLYPRTSASHAVKSDADWQASHHRRAHRSAVPTVAVIKSDAGPWHVECMSCGFVRCDGTTTTRSDADGVRDRHLVNDHGLVGC